jgi:thermostable 8-oxoguanine DNA glycosylase
MTLNFIISPDDIESSERLKEKERINPLTSDEMFRGAIYTMLSTREKYTRQMVMYESLLQQGLDVPCAILEKPEAASKLVSGLRKDEYLLKLAEWWLRSDISDIILRDIYNNRVNEFNIRNKIVIESPGLSYKGASLFLNRCGYVNVVALDVWTLRALVAADYAIESYCYKPKNGKKNFKHTYLGNGIYFDRGINDLKPYVLYEGNFRDLTSKYNSRFNYNFTPLDFRNILWVKRSTWGEKFGNDLNQLTIQF